MPDLPPEIYVPTISTLVAGLLYLFKFREDGYRKADRIQKELNDILYRLANLKGENHASDGTGSDG